VLPTPARVTTPFPTGNTPDSILDPVRLAPYFETHVAGFNGTLHVEPIYGGRSNLTYLISDGASRWVLRRPPLGLVAPTANDIGREYRVVTALRSTSVPVAEAVAFCDDLSVIGAPFSVVSMVDGRVIRTASDGAALSPAEASRAAASLVVGLATIHAVPYQEVGLGSLGRPEGYLTRQLDRWRKQWDTVTTAPLAGVSDLYMRLASAVPQESAATLVHGDYRLDNTILDPHDAGTLAAVVDWEMATLGDPLADLGLMLVYWDPLCGPVLPDGHAISANDGFPSVDEMARAYATASGRDLDHINFYRALGYFKLAIIAEGIHNRFLAGLTVGSGFDTVGGAVAPLVEAGLNLLPG
jgi:aminoglycoside phosphotransferase (APT) family kinase protein